MKARWFIRGGGRTYGPLNDAKLRSLVLAGKIDQSTEVAFDPRGPWQPAGSVRGLFSDNAPPPAVAKPLPESPRSHICEPDPGTESAVNAPLLQAIASDAQGTAGPSSAPLGRTLNATLIAAAVTAGILIGVSLAGVFFMLVATPRPRVDAARAAAAPAIDVMKRPREVSAQDRNRAKYAERILEFIDELRSAAKLLSQRPSPQAWGKKLEYAIDMETRIPVCPEDYRELHQLVQKAWATLRHSGSELVSTLANAKRISSFRIEQDTSAVMAEVSDAVLAAIDVIEADANYARLIQITEEN